MEKNPIKIKRLEKNLNSDPHRQILEPTYFVPTLKGSIKTLESVLRQELREAF